LPKKNGQQKIKAYGLHEVALHTPEQAGVADGQWRKTAAAVKSRKNHIEKGRRRGSGQTSKNASWI
jgi:hypothetical protein